MFAQKLNKAIQEKNSRVCVGLDPRLEWLPKQITQKAVHQHGKTFAAAASAIAEFNKQVIDTIAPFAPAVKPQIAFYEQYGPDGLIAFKQTIDYAHSLGLQVIVDAKRGDIDSTAQAYANSLLGKTDLFGQEHTCYGVDCLTVNPFLGEDSLLPFINTCKKYDTGIFILVKTSNPGSSDLQDLVIAGQTIAEKLASLVAQHAQDQIGADGYSNIGAVVGATFPDEAKLLREKMPHSIFLVPGIGSQGGKTDNIRNFFNTDGLGAIINSSRGIVFSQLGNSRDDYLQKIEKEVKKLRKEINDQLGK
ncbi:MAG: orotidine-5'-phosphate decarboxylase [Patescibacteria group bacterium]